MVKKMFSRILVTWSDGQVGEELQRSNQDDNIEYLFLTQSDLNVSAKRKTEDIVKEFKPDLIINLATFSDILSAEQNFAEAYSINVLGVRNLVSICEKYDIALLHISDTYVFKGDKDAAYIETDPVNPKTVYGKTLALAENLIQKKLKNYVILRTSWLYSNFSNNFFTKFLVKSQYTSELTVNDEQLSSPTSTKELCRAIDRIITKGITEENAGVYHFTGLGITSMSLFAEEVFTAAKIPMIVIPVLAGDAGIIIEEPFFLYLSSLKFISEFGYTPQHWKNALIEMIETSAIVPIKPGYNVTWDNEEYFISSIDWAKRIVTISTSKDNFLQLKFEELVNKIK